MPDGDSEAVAGRGSRAPVGSIVVRKVAVAAGAVETRKVCSRLVMLRLGVLAVGLACTSVTTRSARTAAGWCVRTQARAGPERSTYDPAGPSWTGQAPRRRDVP